MKRTSAIVGSIAFFVVAPCTVAGLVPWWITRWQVTPPVGDIWPVQLTGAVLIAAGVVLLIDCFARFAREGLGTPAPILPTRMLVVTGLYRYVRNPMYVGVVAAILGQSLFFGDTRLLIYGAFIWLAFHLFVLLYEEPMLERTFGEEYKAFRKNVPRWIPRMTPWSGNAATAH
jgi:protein-S-isoprenylcysteine O-methyltransferase Ste14